MSVDMERAYLLHGSKFRTVQHYPPWAASVSWWVQEPPENENFLQYTCRQAAGVGNYTLMGTEKPLFKLLLHYHEP